MSFDKLSQGLAKRAGSPRTFQVALFLIVLWAATGPFFHYNDTWQLIINTSTTIITFLMVFVIQNTQNRDNDVLHIKIDELLRATKEAQNAVIGLDRMTSKELRAIRKQYQHIGENGEVEVSVADTTVSATASKTDSAPQRLSAPQSACANGRRRTYRALFKTCDARPPASWPSPDASRVSANTFRQRPSTRENRDL